MFDIFCVSVSSRRFQYFKIGFLIFEEILKKSIKNLEFLGLKKSKKDELLDFR
jgi:hypothetical protein